MATDSTKTSRWLYAQYENNGNIVSSMLLLQRNASSGITLGLSMLAVCPEEEINTDYRPADLDARYYVDISQGSPQLTPLSAMPEPNTLIVAMGGTVTWSGLPHNTAVAVNYEELGTTGIEAVLELEFHTKGEHIVWLRGPTYHNDRFYTVTVNG